MTWELVFLAECFVEDNFPYLVPLLHKEFIIKNSAVSLKMLNFLKMLLLNKIIFLNFLKIKTYH